MSRQVRPDGWLHPGLLLASIGACAVLAGIVADRPEAAGLGAAFLVPPLVVGWRLWKAVERASVWREAPTTASEGDVVAIRTAVGNPSRFPLCSARIEEVFGPESLLPQVFVFPGRIAEGRTVQAERRATCRRSRGIYPHGPMFLVASDPFGWITLRRRIDLIEEVKLYPRLSRARLPERLVASLCEPETARRARRFSDSDEFFSVRDYQAGDPLKRIHWALFARRDYPVVREYLPTVQPELALFLDVTRSLRFSGARLTNFESSVRLTASLSAHAVRAGFRIQLACGSHGRFDVPPAFGHLQLIRILDTLIRVRTRTEDPFVESLRRRARRLVPGTTCVLPLHPYLMGDDELAGVLGGMAARGMRVVCVVYGVREQALLETAARRHAAFLARLAARGIELWSERGIPLGAAARRSGAA